MTHQPICKKWSLLINGIFELDKKGTCNFEHGSGLNMKKNKHWNTVQFYLTAKSVKSKNQCKSVIQTSYDIVKAYGGEIIVESPPALPRRQAGGEAGEDGTGTDFIIKLQNV